MTVKLTRKETVAACDFLSGINLRGADESFSRKVIVAQMALYPKAKQIREEEEMVRSKFIDTDEAKDKCLAFAKAYQDMVATRNGDKNTLDAAAVQTFSKAYEEVRPYNEAIENGLKALEEHFDFEPEVEPFSMEELVAHYTKIGVDFTIRTFDPISKFLL